MIANPMNDILSEELNNATPWVEKGTGPWNFSIACPNCNFHTLIPKSYAVEYHYCPKCGGRHFLESKAQE